MKVGLNKFYLFFVIMLESLIPIIFVLIFICVIIVILAAVFDKPKIAENIVLLIIVLGLLILLTEVIIYSGIVQEISWYIIIK